MNLLSMSKQQILMMLIARVIIILLILPLHEFAHAWVARLCGDDTADSKGRLTLNPFSHVDPFGAILLLLTGFGWAKPVPINPNRMRNPRTGVIWTSLAGPASNLLIAFVMMIPFRILESIPISSEAMYNTLSIIYPISPARRLYSVVPVVTPSIFWVKAVLPVKYPWITVIIKARNNSKNRFRNRSPSLIFTISFP